MSPATGSDEDLMLRFGGGDAAAFETLYDRHESRVFGYLYRQLRDRARADDLMQDVWLAVARGAQRYEPRAKFTTYLFTVAHNRMVDWLRGARTTLSLDSKVDFDEGAGATLGERLAADERQEPQARAAADEEGAALLAAVAALPEEQRSAFLMHAEGGLSLDEIAAATGASFETVKSRLRYARAKLRQALWEYA